jgi:serine/threonine protein phosphatase PrpC
VTVRFESAIGSHVGMVRSNNQDSGFAGNRLFFVADGMGGHAGGDVASAVTTKDVATIDGETFSTPQEAAEHLAEQLIHANVKLSETVRERPELSGMGTTFTGFMVSEGKLALAHIGDSRLYRMRGGRLEQITKDHTFVQRLVDSGRITEEEAKTHPRRSVLMRVLGDVDSEPDVDTDVLDTAPGDRWMLCSDGLCGYVEDRVIEREMWYDRPLQETVDALIDRALENGAPDNVTVVLVQTVEATAEDKADDHGPRFAGSAANEDASGPVSTGRARLLGRRRKAKVPQVAETHFEPRVDEYLAELIAETKRRNWRRRAMWALSALLGALVLAAAVFFAYQWTQTRYYVGTDGDTVIIYQGIQQSIGPWELHSEAEDTDIPLDSLDGYEQRQVKRTVSTDSLEAARDIVLRLGVNEDE